MIEEHDAEHSSRVRVRWQAVKLSSVREKIRASSTSGEGKFGVVRIWALKC